MAGEKQTKPAPRLGELSIKLRPVMTGKKVKLDDVLDMDLTFKSCVIEPSKYGSSKNRLRLQFMKGDEELMTFTGSTVLIDQFSQLKDSMPFVAIIKKIDKYYTLFDDAAEQPANDEENAGNPQKSAEIEGGGY